MEFVRRKTDRAPTEPAVSADLRTPPEQVTDNSTYPFQPVDEVDLPAEPFSLYAWLRHKFNIYIGLAIAGLIFYVLADYTAYTTAEQRPGQLIFSNTMTQLWTACFRMAFTLTTSLVLLRLFWPQMFRFIRPDSLHEQGMASRFETQLSFYQRVCVCLLVFFGLCLLFVLLLSVNLPQTVSVGR